MSSGRGVNWRNSILKMLPTAVDAQTTDYGRSAGGWRWAHWVYRRIPGPAHAGGAPVRLGRTAPGWDMQWCGKSATCSGRWGAPQASYRRHHGQEADYPTAGVDTRNALISSWRLCCQA